MELYSEQDVISKVVIPTLASLGYDESKGAGVVLRFNHPIAAQQGREKKTIYADLVVHQRGPRHGRGREESS
ncbi:MAG: hypothetical protein GEU78_15445 [Actinobacteria bacterium]|nr:hypothetical protein [Actinomycetota bacterium]